MKRTATISTLLSAGLLCGALSATSAYAVPVSSGTLGLTGGNPDIQANFLDFNFDQTSGSFAIQSAFGGGQYVFNSVAENIINSTFNISGSVVAGDANLSLTITGDLASLGGGDQTLLAGDLLAFSNTGAGVFEFQFGNLSGALAALFGGEAGVIYSDTGLSSGFDFTSDAATTYTGISDSFAQPAQVPISGRSSLILMALGMLMMAVRRPSKNRAPASLAM